MINNKLIDPKSIVVIGGSNDISKPGGRALKNLIDGKYKGDLYVVNPKLNEVQGIKSYKDVNDLPECDLAIIAIAAKYCLQTVEVLAKQKNTRAFIILTAGFSEESKEGAKLEKDILDVVNSVDGSLLGPNCIGYINVNYAGSFVLTDPIPVMDPKGVDLISGSGSTALFILETGVSLGLSMNSIASVGNSAQIGVEEWLEYMDVNYVPGESSDVKLLYIESVKKPEKLLKHARSLIEKGCKIAAVKAGSSDAGSRAASSHTGALAGSDTAVDALFRKAGIVRCYGRNELATVATIFKSGEMKGRNMAIITHAGGPGVMLTDALSEHNINVPHLEAKDLQDKLLPGSSVGNPIDYLVTGTVEHLETIIDYCENKCDNIDGMAVVYGDPKLFDVSDVFDLIHRKIQTCKKPIYPIFPSTVNSKEQIEDFVAKGHSFFPDEVVFGNALGAIMNTKIVSLKEEEYKIDKDTIRKVVENANNGYISPKEIQQLLDAAGIKRAGEAVADNIEDAVKAAETLGYPVVMKVVGPVHKSDVGGVVLNVKDEVSVRREFERMIKIKDTTAILIQPMLSGIELFAGAKYETTFGHLVLCGLGGIFIEVLKDVQSGLAPLSTEEVKDMIYRLKGVKILEGVRGQEGVNINSFIETVVRLSLLVKYAPEIVEMDLNPLLGNMKGVVAVDARIRIEK